VPVYPPEEYLDDCEIARQERDLGSELRRLANLVRCERADKAALRAWIEERRGP